MAKNIIPDIAKMLGVEIEEEFEIEGLDGRYKFTENSLRTSLLSGRWAFASDAPFYWLCNGEHKIIKLPFKPKCKQVYWCVQLDGKITMDFWANYLIDVLNYMTGNCFRTKAEAKAHKPEIMAKFKEVLE